MCIVIHCCGHNDNNSCDSHASDCCSGNGKIFGIWNLIVQLLLDGRLNDNIQCIYQLEVQLAMQIMQQLFIALCLLCCTASSAAWTRCLQNCSVKTDDKFCNCETGWKFYFVNELDVKTKVTEEEFCSSYSHCSSFNICNKDVCKPDPRGTRCLQECSGKTDDKFCNCETGWKFYFVNDEQNVKTKVTQEEYCSRCSSFNICNKDVCKPIEDPTTTRCFQNCSVTPDDKFCNCETGWNFYFVNGQNVKLITQEEYCSSNSRCSSQNICNKDACKADPSKKTDDKSLTLAPAPTSDATKMMLVCALIGLKPPCSAAINTFSSFKTAGMMITLLVGMMNV